MEDCQQMAHEIELLTAELEKRSRPSGSASRPVSSASGEAHHDIDTLLAEKANLEEDNKVLYQDNKQLALDNKELMLENKRLQLELKRLGADAEQIDSERNSPEKELVEDNQATPHHTAASASAAAACPSLPRCVLLAATACVGMPCRRLCLLRTGASTCQPAACVACLVPAFCLPWGQARLY